MLLLRQFHQQRRHLRAIAPAPCPPADEPNLASQLQPFLQRFAPLAVPDAGGVASKRTPPAPIFSHERLSELIAAIGDCGVALRRAGVKGWPFHRGLQRALAELAPRFGGTGFLECAAAYDDPAGIPVAGRMDVVWADAQRHPSALFEIDSTIKQASLEKLRRAAAPHKFWIYFGPDRWGFKTCCRGVADICPIVIPLAFVPH